MIVAFGARGAGSEVSPPERLGDIFLLAPKLSYWSLAAETNRHLLVFHSKNAADEMRVGKLTRFTRKRQ